MAKSQQRNAVFWTRVSRDDWNLIIAATENGLCFVGSPGMDDEEAARRVQRRFPDGVLIEDEVRCKPYADQLAEYLQGTRTCFTIPVDPGGTPFQQEVWEALRRIPYGQTRSYSQIAEQIGKPSSVRAAAAAIGANPLLIAIPCHRVIGKSGRLTGYRGGIGMKKKLLELEKSHRTAERPGR